MKIRYYAILLTLLVFVAACSNTLQEETDNGDAMADDGDAMMEDDGDAMEQDDSMNDGPGEEGHIGCQEGEIDASGNCIPADTSNVMLFGQELEGNVEYMEVSEPVMGFVAMPAQEGEYPGVVMIHEWWGLNNNIKEMAKVLANEGYVVFAVDLYDGEIAEDSSRAGELAGMVRENPEEAVEKMKVAAQYLKDEHGVTTLGSLGWCFGGGQSLQLSLNENVDATVIYYGSLVDDEQQLMSLNGPVLGIFGEEDSVIPVDSVRSFELALDDAGVENDVFIYPGVGHAFANPSGSNYAPDSTLDAWKRTVEFLDANLKSDHMGSDSNDDDSMMEEDVKTFYITGKDYRFVHEGVETPTIAVNKGDTVRIEFESTDGFHDWVVDEFDAATERVRPGDGITTVEFVADEAGTYEFYCSVGSHRANGMVGTLVVES